MNIQDYFLIGDLHSAALVSKDASIDWLCLPHFDSPSIFAKLLDEKAGCFSVKNADFTVSSQYIENTANVEFSFKNQKSEFKLVDFMVPYPENVCDHHFLVRQFTGIAGATEISVIFAPRPSYGQKYPKMEYLPENNVVRLLLDKDLLELHLPKSCNVQNKEDGLNILFSLKQDQVIELLMEYSPVSSCAYQNPISLQEQTIKFWQEWLAKGKFFNFCEAELKRSAITLKLMQFYPTGAIVAAPTTSLPEIIGGERNWDYRYVWIRDATFTLYALYVLGYTEEAEKFFHYIHQITEKSINDDFDISLMYTINGEAVPMETNLPLKGYKNSKPVRIGNGAADQFQLDVYGALIDAHYFISKRSGQVFPLDQNLILRLVDKIDQLWQKKDYGIWEVRSKPQDFTYSKVMAWVGADRALRMSDKLQLTTEQQHRCKSLADTIADWIWQNCYDPVNQTFLQYPKAKHQDATNLLFVLLQFLNKHDPKTKTIIKQTMSELGYNDIFVYRYLAPDGLSGKEGAFLLCTFWLISALAILEDTTLARDIFTRFQTIMSNNNLLSEEINPDTKEYLGNYPQAFSHIGFIMSAYYLHRYSLKHKH